MTQTSTPEAAPARDPRPAPEPAGAATESPWRRWRPVLLRLHFYAGIFVGPFLLIAAVTGLLYALTPQVDDLVHRHELKVEHVGDARLPLSTQLRTALDAYPQGTVASIRPPAAADDTTRIVFTGPDVPVDYNRTVFVDPYSGEVRGSLTTYGEWLPIRAWFDELHRNLHLGELGRNYSELAASWLWLVALGGLALWIGHRRGQRKLRRLALPDRSGPKGERRKSWHAAVGVWTVVGLVFLSITGMTWSRYAGENVAELRAALAWTSPSVSTALPGAAPAADDGAGHAGHGGGGPSSLAPADLVAGVDTVLAAAGREGLRSPVWLTPPATADAAWKVAERKRDVPTRSDTIAVDPASGQVVDRVPFAEWSLPAKLTGWAIDAHMGVLFGIANQLVLLALVGGLITVIVRGYLMWWKRRPTLRAGGPGTPPRRGALNRLRPAEAVAVVAVLAGLAWFAPLLGWSLVAFLVVDVALGLRRSVSGADA